MVFLFTSVTAFDGRMPNILPSAGSQFQAINKVWGSLPCDWDFTAHIHVELESIWSRGFGGL